MLLYLIRHGESEFNRQGRIQGQLDVSLSDRGLRQGEAAADALDGLPIDAVYASPLRRAMETAAPIGLRLGRSVRPLESLKELNAGIFQGLTWQEVAERHAETAVRWRSEDPDFAIPGGESRRMLMARARAAAEAVRASGHIQAVLVGHGGLFGAMLKWLLDVPAHRNPFRLYNGAISRLDWAADARLLTFNETEHLTHLEGDLGRLGNL